MKEKLPESGHGQCLSSLYLSLCVCVLGVKMTRVTIKLTVVMTMMMITMVVEMICPYPPNQDQLSTKK